MHLRPEGWLLLEIGAEQGEKTRFILEENGYENIRIVPDLEGRDRVAVGQKEI